MLGHEWLRTDKKRTLRPSGGNGQEHLLWHTFMFKSSPSRFWLMINDEEYWLIGLEMKREHSPIDVKKPKINNYWKLMSNGYEIMIGNKFLGSFGFLSF